MSTVVTRGMVLAAGLGERMRPITATLPKPLVQVGGKTLLDHALDRLSAAGVTEVVVNVHHLADRIVQHLEGRHEPEVRISAEQDRLETGGGVAKALPMLGNEPFYVSNGDTLWLDGATPALRRLASQWDHSRMDALLLVFPGARAEGYEGAGDFVLDPLGQARRRREREVAPFVFTGVQLLHPHLFRDAPDGPFSLNLLYDRAAEAGRLYAIVHDGMWLHIGTPEAIGAAEDYLRDRRLLGRFP
ncbi:MAG: nucleotidyltransferase family protein [Acetobacterales bacterium]